MTKENLRHPKTIHFTSFTSSLPQTVLKLITSHTFRFVHLQNPKHLLKDNIQEADPPYPLPVWSFLEKGGCGHVKVDDGFLSGTALL